MLDLWKNGELDLVNLTTERSVEKFLTSQLEKGASMQGDRPHFSGDKTNPSPTVTACYAE